MNLTFQFKYQILIISKNYNFVPVRYLGPLTIFFLLREFDICQV